MNEPTTHSGRLLAEDDAHYAGIAVDIEREAVDAWLASEDGLTALSDALQAHQDNLGKTLYGYHCGGSCASRVIAAIREERAKR